MNNKTRIVAAAVAIAASLSLASTLALAQSAPAAPAATPPAAAAPAAKTSKPQSPVSMECSKEADAKGLHGKARKEFRSECKKNAMGGKPS